MTANGFLKQRTARPMSLVAVVLLHGAAIGAVLLFKGPGWIRADDKRLIVEEVQLIPPPPPIEVPPPPKLEKVTPQVPTISRIDVPPRVIPTPVPNLALSGERTVVPPGPVIGSNPGPAEPARPERLAEVPPRPTIHTPIRTEAHFDPRFAGAMQPPYPAAEQRNEREGSVRVRVTIAPDGRVAAVEKVSATSDAFWQVTQRQALGRWRFKPATIDGKPVQSSKVLTVFFKLDQ